MKTVQRTIGESGDCDFLTGPRDKEQWGADLIGKRVLVEIVDDDEAKLFQDKPCVWGVVVDIGSTIHTCSGAGENYVWATINVAE